MDLTHLFTLMLMLMRLMVMVVMLLLLVQIDHIRYNSRLIVVIALIQIQNVRIIPIWFEIYVIRIGRLGRLHSAQQIFVVQNVHVFNVLTQFHAIQFVCAFAHLIHHRQRRRLSDGIRWRQLMIRLIILVIVVAATVATVIRSQAFLRIRLVWVICVHIILFTVKPFSFMRIEAIIFGWLLIFHFCWPNVTVNFNSAKDFHFFYTYCTILFESTWFNSFEIYSEFEFISIKNCLFDFFSRSQKNFFFSTQLKSELGIFRLYCAKPKLKLILCSAPCLVDSISFFTIRPNGKRFHTYTATVCMLRANVSTHSCGKCKTIISPSPTTNDVVVEFTNVCSASIWMVCGQNNCLSK